MTTITRHQCDVTEETANCVDAEVYHITCDIRGGPGEADATLISSDLHVSMSLVRELFGVNQTSIVRIFCIKGRGNDTVVPVGYCNRKTGGSHLIEPISDDVQYQTYSQKSVAEALVDALNIEERPNGHPYTGHPSQAA